MTKNNRNRRFLITGGVLIGLIIVYFMGPKPGKPDFSKIILHHLTTDLQALDDSIKNAEALLPLKSDNEARIVWATPFQKTPYSMVYLHGNGASQEEGDPIHEALAARYGSNLFLARLYDHGLTGENPLKNIDAVKWMQSALDAIAVGHAIGEKVILISCSTGSTLALYLASRYPDLIEAHIMMSPNVDLHDERSWVMMKPWGLQMTRLILGSKFYGWKAPGPAQQYWYTRYRIEGLITLKSMIDATMTTETFSKIIDPLYVSYYYHDESRCDHVVSVQRMRDMFQQVGTPADLKKEIAITDAGTHIIGSDLFNMNIESVWAPIVDFCEEVLKMIPVKNSDWKLFLDFRRTN